MNIIEYNIAKVWRTDAKKLADLLEIGLEIPQGILDPIRELDLAIPDVINMMIESPDEKMIGHYAVLRDNLIWIPSFKESSRKIVIQITTKKPFEEYNLTNWKRPYDQYKHFTNNHYRYTGISSIQI